MHCHLVKQQSAPVIEPGVFDGNPLDFHYFMTFFHKVVGKRIDDPRGRLDRLLKYTSQDADNDQDMQKMQGMFKHCVQEPPTMGY